mmetsp:Transcript_85087/g.214486  ORF Transcript_85087/g.214486 Transcript_85087/m.214486 type:complete len:212 (-) Transcript_85087:127-762(-)
MRRLLPLWRSILGKPCTTLPCALEMRTHSSAVAAASSWRWLEGLGRVVQLFAGACHEHNLSCIACVVVIKQTGAQAAPPVSQIHVHEGPACVAITDHPWPALFIQELGPPLDRCRSLPDVLEPTRWRGAHAGHAPAAAADAIRVCLLGQPLGEPLVDNLRPGLDCHAATKAVLLEQPDPDFLQYWARRARENAGLFLVLFQDFPVGTGHGR